MRVRFLLLGPRGARSPSVKIVPSGAGTVKIARKKDGATVNQGDVLVKGDVLEVQAEPKMATGLKLLAQKGLKK